VGTDRREDLLAAAAQRFVAAGIRKTTMEDIARQAGAGKATLYRYFANKDAVVDALIHREAARFARRLQSAAAAHDRWIERIEAAFVAGVRFLVEHPLLSQGHDEEPAILLPRITAGSGPLSTEGLDLFTELIEQGIAAGELAQIDARAAAEVFMRLILSYLAFPPGHGVAVDPEATVASAQALISGGLRVTAPT
jgi:AcrR family transcriptional regulator